MKLSRCVLHFLLIRLSYSHILIIAVDLYTIKSNSFPQSKKAQHFGCWLRLGDPCGPVHSSLGLWSLLPDFCSVTRVQNRTEDTGKLKRSKIEPWKNTAQEASFEWILSHWRKSWDCILSSVYLVNKLLKSFHLNDFAKGVLSDYQN